MHTLQGAIGRPCPKERVWEAMEYLGKAHRENALADWLKSLEWAGRDWIGELCKQLRISAALDRTLMQKTLIGMVARAIDPGCKLDTMLVLAGPQGIGKSRFVEALCPAREFFSDQCRMSNDRDDLAQLRKVWAAEVAELAALKGWDVESLKSYLSRTHDTYRKPYGRANATYPRHCVFWGTTNEEEFLRDSTGNRRFWVVHLAFTKRELLPIDWVAEHRDDIFAQAVALYKGGEPWWLAAKDEQQLDERNAQYMERDPWEAPILQWAMQRNFFTTGEALRCAVGVTTDRQDKRQSIRVGAILRQAGFVQGKHGPSPQRRCWRNPDPPAELRANQDPSGDVLADEWAREVERTRAQELGALY